MALATRYPLRRGVGVEALRQLGRVAEGWGVPAVDLVRGDTQTLTCHSPEKRRRQEAVVTTEHDSCGHIRPRLDRQRLAKPYLGLHPPSPQRFGRQPWRNVLIEEGDRVAVALTWLLVVPGVSPIVGRGLAGSRNHRRDQDEQSHGDSIADQRRNETAERLGDHDDIPPVP